MSDGLVLVVGGTGTLGSKVVDRLLARGKRVRALVRPTSQTKRLDAAGVELATGDLLEPESLRRALDGVDAVVTPRPPPRSATTPMSTSSGRDTRTGAAG